CGRLNWRNVRVSHAREGNMRSISSRRIWRKVPYLAVALALGAMMADCSNTDDDADKAAIDPDDPSAREPGEATDEMIETREQALGSLDMPMEVDGTETPVSAKYWPLGVDLGAADSDARFRALIAFPLRNQSELASRISSMYDPSSGSFRAYLTFT